MNRLLLAAGFCLASLPALAQIGPTQGYGGSPGGLSGGGRGSGSHTQDDDAGKKDDKPTAPPPAIPGAQPNADTVVIPSDKVAAEMSPNDALFDAINRGDLAAAKDALNRGAQLEAHNVLGQTPTDAAIDLSRNDITFLLLSMRGAVSSSRPVKTAALAKPAHGKPAHAAAQRPSVHVADRGTPNPAVGFTGF